MKRKVQSAFNSSFRNSFLFWRKPGSVRCHLELGARESGNDQRIVISRQYQFRQTKTKWLRTTALVVMDMASACPPVTLIAMQTQDVDKWRKRWIFNYPQRRLNNICAWKSKLISLHSSTSTRCLISVCGVTLEKLKAEEIFMFWRVIIHFWLMLFPMTIRIGRNCRACGNLSFTLINIHESAVCFSGNLALSSDEWNEKEKQKQKRESKAWRHASITSNCWIIARHPSSGKWISIYLLMCQLSGMTKALFRLRSRLRLWLMLCKI